MIYTLSIFMYILCSLKFEYVMILKDKRICMCVSIDECIRMYMFVLYTCVSISLPTYLSSQSIHPLVFVEENDVIQPLGQKWKSH